jgi:hypothetical protein
LYFEAAIVCGLGEAAITEMARAGRLIRFSK